MKIPKSSHPRHLASQVDTADMKGQVETGEASHLLTRALVVLCAF